MLKKALITLAICSTSSLYMNEEWKQATQDQTLKPNASLSLPTQTPSQACSCELKAINETALNKLCTAINVVGPKLNLIDNKVDRLVFPCKEDFLTIPFGSQCLGSGSLCLDFGSSGTVTTSFGMGTNSFAYEVLAQSGGKTVAVGGRDLIPGLRIARYFALARYNMDGSLDSSFGTGGIVINNFGRSFALAYAGVVQPDCKIVAAGTIGEQFMERLAVARYNTDGSLDSSFGTGGIVQVVFPDSAFSEARAVLLQPDGKIVAVGFMKPTTGPSLNENFALVRLNIDGTPDSSFGTGGLVTTNINPSQISEDIAYSVLLQPDGKIVALGSTRTGSDDFCALARYNSDGSLDTSFGTAGTGIVTTVLAAGTGLIASGALQPDGKIVGGGGDSYFDEGAIVRYNSNGTLDSSFGTGGIVMTGPESRVYDVVLQPDGKIIAVIEPRFQSSKIFTLMRYNSDGILDTSFGTNGTITTFFDDGSSTPRSRSRAGVLRRDGNLIVVGGTFDGSFHRDFALACYEICTPG